MAKTIVQHDEDPGIAIILEQDENGVTCGRCTECGYEVESVISVTMAHNTARRHIMQHESGQ